MDKLVMYAIIGVAVLFIALLIALSLSAAIYSYAGGEIQPSLRSKAMEFCFQDDVSAVYIVQNEYIKVVSSLLGGGSTFYKLDALGNVEKQFQCPVVGPDAMTEDCKTLLFGELDEKQIC